MKNTLSLLLCLLTTLCSGQTDWSKCQPSGTEVFVQEISYLAVVAWDSTAFLESQTDSSDINVKFNLSQYIGRPTNAILALNGSGKQETISDTIVAITPRYAVGTKLNSESWQEYVVRVTIVTTSGKVINDVFEARLEGHVMEINDHAHQQTYSKQLKQLLAANNFDEFQARFRSEKDQDSQLQRILEPCRVPHLQNLLNLNCVLSNSATN